MSDTLPDGWIKHDGGKPPMGHQCVSIRFRDGSELTEFRSFDPYDWAHDFVASDIDIVAYLPPSPADQAQAGNNSGAGQ